MRYIRMEEQTDRFRGHIMQKKVLSLSLSLSLLANNITTVRFPFRSVAFLVFCCCWGENVVEPKSSYAHFTTRVLQC